MTVVIACRFPRYVVVFADCRVSYDPQGSLVDDNLQKLYQFGEVILGFAGPVQGANQVIQRVKRNAEAYPRRKHPTASNLRRDIERWIRYEYRNIHHPEHRKNLCFLLASGEPSREARSKHKRRLSDGVEVEIPKPEWFPSIPELTTLVLKPSKSEPKELIKEEREWIKVIGPSDEDTEAIQRTLAGAYGFARKYPSFQARAALDWVMASLMRRNVVKAGGLLQCALLGTWGIRWVPYRSRSSYGDVALVLADGHWVQRNAVTGEMIPLLTTWEWCEWQKTHSPGSSGVFEDPGLRKAIGDLRKAKNGSNSDSQRCNE